MDLLSNNLAVMDHTAATLCSGENLPIVVFDILKEGNLRRILQRGRGGVAGVGRGERGRRRLSMSDVIDLTAAERRMGGAVESVKSNFATIRTGRANPSLLDRIEVEVYGTRMALRSVANVGVPEARLLTVTPFDPNSLKDIERAIRDADIGLNPQNDGKILRLPIPELTEERRRDLIRMAR